MPGAISESALSFRLPGEAALQLQLPGSAGPHPLDHRNAADAQHLPSMLRAEEL